MPSCAAPAADRLLGPEGPAGNPSGDPEPTPVAQGHALPKDNRDAAGTGAVFTDDNGWYICAAGAVSYYDYASGQTMTLCAQPGCSHGDASCQAWVGNVNSFAVLDGVLYATLDNAGSGAQLVRQGAVRRESHRPGAVGQHRSTISTPPPWGVSPAARPPCIWNAASRSSRRTGGSRAEPRAAPCYTTLPPGSYRELSVPGTLMGFSARWGAVVETPEEQSLLSAEDFTAQYGEDASYGRYLHQNIQRRLLLWDMESGDYTVVADHNKDGYIMTADPRAGLRHGAYLPVRGPAAPSEPGRAARAAPC